MKMNVTERMRFILEPKKAGIRARLFVTRDDGITIYDSVQDKSTNSVAALVSGVWQASEALMGLVQTNQELVEFRFGYDTSAQGIFLLPMTIWNKNYFLGAIYENCLNPGQLKRQVSLVKEEVVRLFADQPAPAPRAVKSRDGYLFKDISDEEIDRLFSVNGI